jgi:hypothetical protein
MKKELKQFQNILKEYLKTDLALQGMINEEERLKRLQVYCRYIELINKILKNPENNNLTLEEIKTDYKIEMQAIYV